MYIYIISLSLSLYIYIYICYNALDLTHAISYIVQHIKHDTCYFICHVMWHTLYTIHDISHAIYRVPIKHYFDPCLYQVILAE